MLRAALLALSLVAAPDMDAPREGVGPYPDLHRWGLEGVDTKPLAAIGDDVLRVTSAPVLSGRGYILELRALAKAEHQVAARGELTFLERHSREPLGHGRGLTPWRRSGSMPVFVYEHEWGPFIARVDALLAQHQTNDPEPPNTPGAIGFIRICTDGDGHAVERRTFQGERWMAEACVDHDPSRDIQTLAQALILDRFCDYLTEDKDCHGRYRRPFP